MQLNSFFTGRRRLALKIYVCIYTYFLLKTACFAFHEPRGVVTQQYVDIKTKFIAFMWTNRRAPDCVTEVDNNARWHLIVLRPTVPDCTKAETNIATNS
jgi:hypothetical protein